MSNDFIVGTSISAERIEIPSTLVTRIREVYSANWSSPRTPTFSHTEIRTLDGGVYLVKQDKQQLRLDEVHKVKMP